MFNTLLFRHWGQTQKNVSYKHVGVLSVLNKYMVFFKVGAQKPEVLIFHLWERTPKLS